MTRYIRFAHLLVLLATLLTVGRLEAVETASDCEKKVVKIRELKPGQLLLVKVRDLNLLIYKRTAEDTLRDSESVLTPNDSKAPSWWQAKYYSLMKFEENPHFRSMTPPFFVAWGVNPASGYGLSFLVPGNDNYTEKLAELGITRDVNHPVFIDYPNKMVFDTTGRIMSSNIDKGRLRRDMHLLTPNYRVSQNMDILTYLCS